MKICTDLHGLSTIPYYTYLTQTIRRNSVSLLGMEKSLLVTSSFLLLVAMPGAPSSFLLLLVMASNLLAMPFAPKAPSSVLAPSSDALCS